MSKWISAKERLPECDQGLEADGAQLLASAYVLVCGTDPNGDRVLGVARYLIDINDRSWDEWDGMMINTTDAIYCDITHWMPIPEMSEEVQG